MIEPLLDAVRAETSGERALDTVRAIARHHRIQASPGYDAASAWLEGELRGLGLEVTVERVPADGRHRVLGQLMPEGWACDHARAVLHGTSGPEPLADFAHVPLSVIQRSDSARGRFPLVEVDDGTSAADYEGVDVRGRVVVTSGAVQRVHELAVVERGAAGILSDGRRLVPPVRTDAHDRESIAYTSFWWNGDEPRGWGVVVSPAAGQRIRERLRAGEALEIEADIATRRFATTIPLLSARLRGTEPGEVLVVSHLCHPQPSANDNASGVAANLETARVLAALATRGLLPEPRCSIRFLWVPELTGTHAWLGLEPGRPQTLRAALNLDMVGEDQEACGSTFLLEHPPCFAASFAEELMAYVRRRAQDWITSYSGPGHFGLARMAEVPFGGGSDHVVFVDPAIGVPCPMLIQWPDRYYHSSYDTPDRSDPRSLALAVRCAATWAAWIAGPAIHADVLVNGCARRVFEARDAADGRRALLRERERIDSIARSLERLPNADWVDAFDRPLWALFGPLLESGTGGGDSSGPHARVPVRRLSAPLHAQRFLIEGWRELPETEREAWRDAESAPGAALRNDMAWMACDGKRNVGEIARLLYLETGETAPDAIAQFFERTERLGLSHWAGNGR